jgi:hypothetical protein
MPTLIPTGRRTRTLAVRCLPIVLAGCGGATDAADPAPTGPTPTIAVAPAAALTVEPGGSATTTVGVTRSGGFGGAVDLALADLAAGITATLAPGTLASDAAQSVVTTTVSAGVAPGSYALAVTGSGAGVRAVRATIPVTVARAQTAPAIAVSGPAAAAVTRGATATAAFVLARTAHAGVVTLTAERVRPALLSGVGPRVLEVDPDPVRALAVLAARVLSARRRRARGVRRRGARGDSARRPGDRVGASVRIGRRAA